MSDIGFINSLACAEQLDVQDKLSSFKQQFHIPSKDRKDQIYLCGNSLGLQPKSVASSVSTVLNDWSQLAVDAHFSGADPWAIFHQKFKPLLAPLVGALPDEVVAMNSLTANLHLMLATFYKPTAKRFKILTESRNFSSDIYALRSQVQLHGMDSDEAIIEIQPTAGTECIDEGAIIALIEQHADSLALVMLSPVNFYSGQLLRMQSIAEAARSRQIVIGLDLAHAIGNVPLALHDWDIDFAVWCSYKYLNSGPGGVGGAYVHTRHATKPDLIRPAGWWGHRAEDRFQMNKAFIPSLDADGFQLSNAPVISMAAHHAALLIFERATIKALVIKSQLLTSFLMFLLKENCCKAGAEFKFRILTPDSMDRRGAQLSLEIMEGGRKLFEMITEAGFMVDIRSNKVIRITPVPLYNSFVEVFQFVEFLKGHAALV